MSYPTMPQSTDNQGDNHRAAIAVLEESLARNRQRQQDAQEHVTRAQAVVTGQTTIWEELRGEAESLQRGIAALKGMDQ